MFAQWTWIKVSLNACWQNRTSGTTKHLMPDGSYFEDTSRGLYICAILTIEHKWGPAAEIREIYWDDLKNRRFYRLGGDGTANIGKRSLANWYVEWWLCAGLARFDKTGFLPGSIRLCTNRGTTRIKHCSAKLHQPKRFHGLTF